MRRSSTAASSRRSTPMCPASRCASCCRGTRRSRTSSRIIRSIHHEFADHGGGHKRFLTGRMPASPVGSVNDAPAVTLDRQQALDAARAGDADLRRWASMTAAAASIPLRSVPPISGRARTPFMVAGDPSAPDFKVQNIGLTPDMETRLEDRVHLLERHGPAAARRGRERPDGRDGRVQPARLSHAHLAEGARRPSTSAASRRKCATRYGHATPTASAASWRGASSRPAAASSRWCGRIPIRGETIPQNCSYNWDSHAVNCHMFDDCRWRMPVLRPGAHRADRGHLRARPRQGRDDRRDRVNLAARRRSARRSARRRKSRSPAATTGRMRCRMLVSGGGMRTGQVIGATNPRGEYPSSASFRRTISGRRSIGTSASTTTTASPTSRAARCRSCRSARRLRKSCRRADRRAGAS